MVVLKCVRKVGKPEASQASYFAIVVFGNWTFDNAKLTALLNTRKNELNIKCLSFLQNFPRFQFRNFKLISIKTMKFRVLNFPFFPEFRKRYSRTRWSFGSLRLYVPNGHFYLRISQRSRDWGSRLRFQPLHYPSTSFSFLSKQYWWNPVLAIRFVFDYIDATIRKNLINKDLIFCFLKMQPVFPPIHFLSKFNMGLKILWLFLLKFLNEFFSSKTHNNGFLRTTIFHYKPRNTNTSLFSKRILGRRDCRNCLV